MYWPEILQTYSLVYLHPALHNTFIPASLTRPIRLRNRRQVLANMVFYNRVMISVVFGFGECFSAARTFVNTPLTNAHRKQLKGLVGRAGRTSCSSAGGP